MVDYSETIEVFAIKVGIHSKLNEDRGVAIRVGIHSKLNEYREIYIYQRSRPFFDLC